MPLVVGSVTAVQSWTSMATTTTGLPSAETSVSPSLAHVVMSPHCAPTPHTSGSTIAQTTCAHHVGLWRRTFQFMFMSVPS